MANTTFEMRGHKLYQLVPYTRIFFIFSAALEGRIQHYYFWEQISAETHTAGDLEWINGNTLVAPLAKGTAGSPTRHTLVGQSVRLHRLVPEGKSKALLNASTRDDRVFVRVELQDVFRPLSFTMTKIMGARMDEVVGHIERATGNPDILEGDPWKLRDGVNPYRNVASP